MDEKHEYVARENQRLSRANEFWYMVVKEMLATVIRTAGLDAARELEEAVKEYAHKDFITSDSVDSAVEGVAAHLLEDLRKLSRMWEEQETIERYGRHE